MARRARRMAGEGGLYERADGMWVASLDLGVTSDGRRRRWTAKSRTMEGALEKLRKARADLRAFGDIPTASPTLEHWLNQWLRDIVLPGAKPRTHSEYESTCRLHIIPAIGRIRLGSLTPAHVRRAMHGPLAAGQTATAAKVHRTLSTALTAAEREGLVPRNVARLTALPRTTANRQSALSTDQARILLATTRGTAMGARWMSALLLGGRQGEILGLEWDRVDLDHGVADIAWQLQRLPYLHGCKGAPESPSCGKPRPSSCPDRQLNVPAGFEARRLEGSLCLTRPKTQGSRRIVPLPAPLILALRDMSAAVGASRHGLVWCREDGRPIDSKDDRDAWGAALTGAGLPDVKLHAARHTTATLLLEMGVDAKVIEQILGHTSVVTTRGYQQVSQAMTRKALDGLGEVIAS